MHLLPQIALSLFSILPGNYSGITPLGGNDYAIVDDKDNTDGFRILSLQIDTQTAKVKDAKLTEPEGMAGRRKMGQGRVRDCEGIAFCPSRQTLFVSGEADQRIIEYSLDGIPTGRELEIPPYFSLANITPNYGFEALAYDAQRHLFWTTTESTLRSDGMSATLANNTVGNRLRLLSFSDDMHPAASYAYQMDQPTVSKSSGTYVFGVPALLAMPDGTLLVVEREAFIPPMYIGSFCRIKLFRVTLTPQSQITDTSSLALRPADGFATKTLLSEFTTHLNIFTHNFANYEGICLGPQLADGRQTVLLISDSQGAYGNSLFHLKDYLKVIIL